MFRYTLVLLALCCTLSLALPAAQEPKPLPTIEVSDPKDLKDVQGVNDALSSLSEKVTACVKAGGKPETCQCSYPQNLSSLRKGYESLIKEHPGWKDQLVSYHYLNNEGRNISGTLVLQNLR